MLENDKGAECLGCCMVLLGEVINGKTWQFSRTILSKEERRNAINPICEASKTT